MPLIKKYIQEKEVHAWVDNIFSQVLNSGKKYDYVVGLERGGLHLSLPLSKKLKIPHKSVQISFYDFYDNVRDEPLIKGDFKWKPNGLLADDLIDKGQTIREFKKVFGEIDVAVLLWHKNSTFYRKQPEYYAQVKPDEWVVFPWEAAECAV